MAYLLDTCVLSEFKKKQPEQKIIDWLNAQIEETLFLSMVTIGEIQKGIFRRPPTICQIVGGRRVCGSKLGCIL